MSSGSDSLGAPGPPAAPGDAPYDPAIYWSDRLAGSGGLESVGWQSLGEFYNRWLYRRRATVFRAAARHYGWQRRPPAVLELGPGTGFYVDLWARLGVRELTGIDIAPPAVARLRRRFPHYQFLSGDIGRPMALPPHAFDVVTAFDVLFHIVNDAGFEQALRSIARALRPGGLALITDLFPPTREIRLPHQVSRTAGRYQEALAAAGLRVERRWPVFVLMHPWSEPRSAAPRLWWSAVERIAGHIPGAGAPLGATLFAADTALARFAGAGPSTQLWAVRSAED
ncbi:MAG: class I SAM-dependent methyltransferase [Dehalococcoidia bacterium]